MSDPPPRPLDRLSRVRNHVGRHGPAFVWLVLVAGLTAQGIWLRIPAWNPPSLFFDDQWVGIVATRMTVSDYLALRPPVPAGFALLLAVLARLFTDPEWSLQLLPVVCSVAQIPLVGWTLFRITGRPSLSLLAAAMVVVDPRLSTFGVRVKPYALDSLLAVGLVLLATWVAESPGRRRTVLLAAASSVAALFSFPALFVGAALVGAFLLRDLGDGKQRRPRMLESFLAPLVFSLGSGLVYVLLLQTAARPSLLHYWQTYFLPLRSLDEVGGFLATRGAAFLTGPFPRAFAWTALLVPVGLAVLLWQRSTRWLGMAVVLLCAFLLAASALRRYPIGGARTDLFAHGIIVILACCALVPLLSSLSSRGRRLSSLTVAVAALALALCSARPSRYPPRRDAELVRQAHAALGPDDALLLYPAAGVAAGYYWPGDVQLRPDRRPCGFTAVVRHPRSLTLDPKRRNNRPSAVLTRLRPFLERAPARIVYLATSLSVRTHRLIVESVVEAGYEAESRGRGPVGALTVFRRARSRTAPGTEPGSTAPTLSSGRGGGG